MSACGTLLPRTFWRPVRVCEWAAARDADKIEVIQVSMSPEPQRREPSVIVVMGVSGAGKTTIAAMLAMRLGWTFEDADWFHPPANVEKMHAGKPLTDEDRWPWLRAIAEFIERTQKAGQHAVIACSALKRAYRNILIGSRREVRLVYLQGRARPDRTQNDVASWAFHAALAAREPVCHARGAGRGRRCDCRVHRCASS